MPGPCPGAAWCRVVAQAGEPLGKGPASPTQRAHGVRARACTLRCRWPNWGLGGWPTTGVPFQTRRLPAGHGRRAGAGSMAAWANHETVVEASGRADDAGPARAHHRPGPDHHPGRLRGPGRHHDPARDQGRPPGHRPVLGHQRLPARPAGRHRGRRRPGRPARPGPAVRGRRALVFVLGLTIGGLAPSMLVLVLARGLQGLGAGAIPAVAYAAIGRSYPEALRPRVFAVLSTAWVVPGLIGPAVSALVAASVGWRWVFLGLLPLVVARRPGLAVAPPARLAGGAAGPAGPAGQGGRRGRRRRPGPGRSDQPLAGRRGAAGRRRPGRRPGPAARPAPPGDAHGPARPAGQVLSRGLLTFAFFGADTYVPWPSPRSGARARSANMARESRHLPGRPGRGSRNARRPTGRAGGSSGSGS